MILPFAVNLQIFTRYSLLNKAVFRKSATEARLCGKQAASKPVQPQFFESKRAKQPAKLGSYSPYGREGSPIQ